MWSPTNRAIVVGTRMRRLLFSASRVAFAAPVILLTLSCLMGATDCQENAIKNLSPSLQECYDGTQNNQKWNLMPHTMETLIAILRKIEDHQALNMDLRQLSTAILHRFRQDGIVKNPKVKAQEGIMPYAPLGQQFYRHAQTLRVIPGSAVNFPNDSISALERCTLHSMISSSIDIYERGDESRVCKIANYAYRRYQRSLDGDGSFKEDVEILTPEQMEMMSQSDIDDDPSAMYPPLPPNHPSRARLVNDLPPHSRCPTENGVIKTRWGSVSGGSVIAGIAASLEPQTTIRVDDLIKQQAGQQSPVYSADARLDNKFLGTLAGDLAEVALSQGPQQSERYGLGADGNWNSTSQPVYYFLAGNENLQMTGAEIRGDLDGLVLASQVPNYYGRLSGLRLSQVLDMYYSDRGLFDKKYRACNRRSHALSVAPTETLVSQTRSAAIVLSTGIATATFSPEIIEKFANQAVKDLSAFIPTMNNDLNCEFTDHLVDLASEPAVDLTIILDTSWPFDRIKTILSQILAGLEVSKYNSNFTLINGVDGSVIVNSSNSILDFHLLNSTFYEQSSRGFNLLRSLERLRDLQLGKMYREQRHGQDAGRSNVVLIVPYQSVLSQIDKELCYESLKIMRAEVPDINVLFLTHGSKDIWTDLVLDPTSEIFVIGIGETTESYSSIDSVQSKIKQVPRRLINTKCGINDDQIAGSSRPLVDYVEPVGINYYKIHPRYFFSDDTANPPRIKIQAQNTAPLKICTSRELLHVNATEAAAAASCVSVTSRMHTITLSCEGAAYRDECKPYYLSVSSNSNSVANYACTDPKVCRFPYNIKYTISFENLVCKSNANTLIVAPILLLTVVALMLFS